MTKQKTIEDVREWRKLILRLGKQGILVNLSHDGDSIVSVYEMALLIFRLEKRIKELEDE